LKSKLEEILNEKIVDENFSSGGCIADSMVIKTISGKEYFVKQYGNPAINRTEANGLKEIKKSNTIRVPEVIFYNNSYLIIEFIKSAGKVHNFSELFGRRFADMHRITGKSFGFYENNFIGSTPQINLPNSSNWKDFYWENRLLYQFKLAKKNGFVDPEFIKKFSTLEKKIDRILSHNVQPSLLHGDLWSGNYIVDEKGEPCLIDPAVYYGDREADLAMTKIFGGFDSYFYAAYNEAYPLREGWQYRENVYKLYHLLNHLNIFGVSYYDQSLHLINYYL